MVRYCFYFLSICITVSCSNKNKKIIVENYTYQNSNHQTIHAVNIGNEYVNEFNFIDFAAVKHECVDETKAKVKLLGKIIATSDKEIKIKTGSDTIIGNLNFIFPKSIQVNNKQAFVQGIIQIHPTINFTVDGILVKSLKVAKKEIK